MDKNIFQIIKRITDGFESRGNISLKPLNLTISQCGVLNYLNSKENYTAPIKDIEKNFKVSQATMQGTINRLEKKNFVSLITDTKDKRIKLVSLTELGKEIWIKANIKREKADEFIFSDFTLEEREVLKLLLMKIYNKLDD